LRSKEIDPDSRRKKKKVRDGSCPLERKRKSPRKKKRPKKKTKPWVGGKSFPELGQRGGQRKKNPTRMPF